MTERRPGRVRRHRCLALAFTGLMLGLAPVVGDPPSGATVKSTGSGTPAMSASAATATTNLTLGQWKQSYEHDIGILADDVLVVVDDGKRAQLHVTTAKVKTTLKDCRQWVTDAGFARSAAPPIPLAAAERAWTSMIGASSRAATACVAALQRGSRQQRNGVPETGGGRREGRESTGQRPQRLEQPMAQPWCCGGLPLDRLVRCASRSSSRVPGRSSGPCSRPGSRS